MFLLGLFILVAGLLISVALHELGHMLPAKKFGALVPEYWIGFGPTLWKTKKKGTTYGLKALPLGGFVRILGMFYPDGKGPKVKRDGRETLAEMARQQSRLELDEAAAEGMRGVPFYALSTPKKLIIMLGGPVMNLLIAVLLVAIVTLGIGWNAPSTTIAEVPTSEGAGESAAMAAGIEPGDTITSWNGKPISSWQGLTEQIQATSQPVEVVVERDGQLLTLTAEPTIAEDGSRYLGVVSAVERQRGTVGDVASTIWMQTKLTGQAVVALPVSLYELTTSFFTGEERDQSGVLSIVGVARLAGEITGTPSTTGGEGGLPSGVSFLDRAGLMLSLLGALNMALFIFNLIPLPPLDGGHVVGALWGGLRNTFAKLRGKPKPLPADTARMVPVSYVVFAVLMVMTLILVVADLVKPITFV
ncbi:M50 family metallopeptidase [Actinomyces minihominis]|uniref:M50 family metallopeptidase n=1 Tax=Actinomyces minihominis TaxID=2002838 RepID=UPI001F5D6608|nr:M50 family metallopeptidase [Actinomyces minihominis]